MGRTNTAVNGEVGWWLGFMITSNLYNSLQPTGNMNGQALHYAETSHPGTSLGTLFNHRMDIPLKYNAGVLCIVIGDILSRHLRAF